MRKKYIRIYDDIAEGIHNGYYAEDSLLPSEHILMKKYETSRETIRKALKLLSEHGYIQKIQGKGSVVLGMDKVDFPVSGLVSFKELADKLGDKVTTFVTAFEISANDNISSKHLAAEKDIWKIERVREINGEKIILDKDYIIKDLLPGLTKEICENSIYEYAENTAGLIISFARKEITVEKPDSKDQELLDLNNYDSIVVVRNYVYLDNAVLFQYTESRHRPDKFRFVDFARRNR
ncbi:trehalose operon repressor [Alteribacillus sp. HJP-4]|uniref:trehalose operon repressor n=1 Tax=Alteribacillus sp. HJP-4 TaxID=2775394 RepID=UPI0035CCE293